MARISNSPLAVVSLQISWDWIKISFHLLRAKNSCILMKPWTSGNKSKLPGKWNRQCKYLFSITVQGFNCNDYFYSLQDVFKMFRTLSCPVPFYISSPLGKRWWYKESVNYWRCIYSSLSKSSPNCQGILVQKQFSAVLPFTIMWLICPVLLDWSKRINFC